MQDQPQQRKSMLVGLGVVALVIIGGVLIWVLTTSDNQRTSDQSPSTQTPSNESTESEETENQTPTAEASTVAIKGFAFSPAKIQVKKGTKVVWTNEDSVGHSVIADDPSNAGGLPSEAGLLQKGESFTHTFTETGIFSYHCGPHPNMKGTVEVVE